VTEIKRAIPGAIWNFCPTTQNPADLLTYGISIELLSSPGTLWWKGPPWLTTSHSWPNWQPEPAVHLHAAAAIAKEFIPQPPIHPNVGLHQIIKPTNFRFFWQATGCHSLHTSVYNNLCRLRPKLHDPLTAEGLNLAQIRWIQACHGKCYLFWSKEATFHQTASVVCWWQGPLAVHIMLRSVSWSGFHTCCYRTTTSLYLLFTIHMPFFLKQVLDPP